jgi:hypothetical protein
LLPRVESLVVSLAVQAESITRPSHWMVAHSVIPDVLAENTDVQMMLF